MAAWWFPSNDHPLDKAVMDLHITVPKGNQVVAGGRLESVRRAGDHTTYHWRGRSDDHLPGLLRGRSTSRSARASPTACPTTTRSRSGSRPPSGGPRLPRARADARDRAVAGLQGRPLPLGRDRRCRHQPRHRLLPRDPDPPDLPLRRLPDPDGARAGPPVVRRLGLGPPLARRLAQRGVRDLHGGSGGCRTTAAGPRASWLHQTYDSWARPGRSRSPTRVRTTSSTRRSTSAVA